MEKPAVTTVEGLRIALEELGLCTKGHKPELKQRFRKAMKKQKDSIATPAVIKEVKVEEEKNVQPFDYYLFFDVEATCIEGGGFTYANEIIEFPVILIDEFRSYVKPTINPTLSDFCTNLTGITQSTVDQSPTFVEVLNDFQEFLSKYDLFQTSTAAFVTDGPFDIRDFITKQCKHSKIKRRPAYFDIPWVDIRKLFREFYHQKENKNINNMLSHLKMEFQGREHSGLDDARNLAAIGKKMHEQGCLFKTNCRYDPKRHNVGRRQRR
ncbi:hypothetical protein INT47_002013 [Mucor saturninus]|uniref:SAP domain-containing protein n=1 Tax=Mucor saturninus TaxID=64648 RepID=A0A8H7R003_9FUNG|nr:hypothetical protein INT47_002013 [Mucor saturninus]